MNSDKMYIILNKTFIFIDDMLTKLFSKIELAVRFFISAIFLVSKTVLKVISLFLNTINGFYRNNNKIIRNIGLPVSALVPIVYRISKKENEAKYPLLIPGMHMVRARVGGGKSLTSFAMAEFTLKEYGLASYLTSPVEKPQLSEDGKYYYVMHRVIDPKNYYSKGKKILNYNTGMYPYYHKDERHLTYNPRLNKTKSYNETWIPEHEDELLMRHDGFRLIVKYSQHLKLDSQEMETITLMHEVQTVKNLTVKNWLNNGRYDFVPIKLKFVSYYIDTDFDGSMKRRIYKKWSLPITQELLDKYDTHAERNKHAGLPVDYERKNKQ